MICDPLHKTLCCRLTSFDDHPQVGSRSWSQVSSSLHTADWQRLSLVLLPSVAVFTFSTLTL